jgi:hypothetical protein
MTWLEVSWHEKKTLIVTFWKQVAETDIKTKDIEGLHSKFPRRY